MFGHCCPAQSVTGAKVAVLPTVALVVLGVLSPIPARAQTETVLYSFTYPTYTPGVGCPPGTTNANPHAGLLVYNGHLFGTTSEGGSGAKLVPDSADGQVFRLMAPTGGGTPWTKDTLHSFVPDINPDDGAYPCSGLILVDGNFIGTTLTGGNGVGSIYAMTPPITGETAWTETILYTFKDQDDGAEPFGGLASLIGLGLFGVTYEGPNGSAVFQFLDDQITQLTINSKGAPDCTTPTGALCIYNGDLLAQDSTDSLFGTTKNGGAYGCGNVFQLTYSGGTWNYTDLYDFTGGSDGATPNGGLVGGAGNLFGTTQGGGNGTGSDGGGVLFELRQEIGGSPLYTLIVQHTFEGGVSLDGAVPLAGLYQDTKGNFWGTTAYGGVFRRNFQTYGTIFELYPDRTIVNDWHYQVAYDFGGEPDGAYPQSLLSEDGDGNLYGTTNEGGSANGGTVFRLKP
jgi:uncharacterized repeat protein (TIGR03803 family)